MEQIQEIGQCPVLRGEPLKDVLQVGQRQHTIGAGKAEEGGSNDRRRFTLAFTDRLDI